jgi:hypothetical protein
VRQVGRRAAADWAACSRVLIQIKACASHEAISYIMDWNPITSAPFERDIELAVLDQNGEHSVTFACRRSAEGWLSARSNRPIDIRPTHWRQWIEKSEAAAPMANNELHGDSVTARRASLETAGAEETACAEDDTTTLTPDEEVRLLHILE